MFSSLKKPPETLEELFDHGAEAAKMLFERQGELMPMFLGLTDDGKILPITGIMPPADMRDALAEALKDLFKSNDIVMYVAMIESWMRKVKPGTAEADLYITGKRRVSDDADKEEIIIVQAEDSKGRSIAGFYTITRADGKPSLGKLEKADGVVFGRFSELLGSPRKH